MTDNDDMLNDLLQPLRQKRRARAAREAGLSRVPRERTHDPSFRRYRRPATVAVAGLIVAGIIGPPVLDALRYGQLVDDVTLSRGVMEQASTDVQHAQSTFHTASEGALRTRGDVEAFVAVIDRRLLSDTSALDQLNGMRDSFATAGDLRETDGRLVTPAEGTAPILPAQTDPATTSGLSITSRLHAKVTLNLRAKASELDARSEDIDGQMTRARDLTEQVLASAADYGTKLRTYPKAEAAAKTALAAAIAQLTSSNLDPIGRFTAFQAAVDAVKASHIKVLREDAARKAAEAAAKKAAEEAAAREAAEAARRAEEERQRLETPTPTATPVLTPTATPTAAPSAEPTVTSTPTPTIAPTPALTSEPDRTEQPAS